MTRSKTKAVRKPKAISIPGCAFHAFTKKDMGEQNMLSKTAICFIAGYGTPTIYGVADSKRLHEWLTRYIAWAKQQERNK